MPTILLSAFIAAFKAVFFGWLGKLATKNAIEWILLSIGEQYVKSTKTKADDKWFEGFREIVEEKD